MFLFFGVWSWKRESAAREVGLVIDGNGFVVSAI